MKFNHLIPELYVSDYDKSLKFYTDLGFKIEYKRERPKFAFLSYQGSQLMIQEFEPEWVKGKLDYPYGRGINLQINTRDINSVLQSLLKINYPINNKIEENTYNVDNKIIFSKELLIMDPDGYLLRFSQDIEEKAVK
jgi:catechol 2,3-dioxygenase-like lactoylglutathione lyase family enzyme